MRYLKRYKIFESSPITEEEESIIVNDLNDIFNEVRDEGIEVVVESTRMGKVLGDSITIRINGIVSYQNVNDYSLPTFKLGDIIDVIFRADDYLKRYSYLIQPIFTTKVSIGDGATNYLGVTGKHKDNSMFTTLDKLKNLSNKECSHVSLNWRIPIDYMEMRKRLRNTDN